MVEEMQVFANNFTNCLFGYNKKLQDNYSSDKGTAVTRATHSQPWADFLLWHGDEIYHLLVKEFLRKVVGGKTWKNNCYRLLLPEYCSMGSAAFCLLTLENNCDRWLSKANSGAHSEMK